MQQIEGQVTIYEWIKTFEREPINEIKWQCYYCKHLNRKKKQVTGTKRHLYMFGCNVSDNGYVPGGAAIGDEDKWLKMFGCGMFNAETLDSLKNHVCAQYGDMCNMDVKSQIAKEMGTECTGFCCKACEKKTICCARCGRA